MHFCVYNQVNDDDDDDDDYELDRNFKSHFGTLEWNQKEIKLNKHLYIDGILLLLLYVWTCIYFSNFF